MTVHLVHAPSGVSHAFVPKKAVGVPLAQTAAYLSVNGVEVEVHAGAPGRPLDPEALSRSIGPNDLLVAPLVEGTACAETLELLARLRADTGARAVATSYLASFASEEILEAFPGLDHVIRGEEELALLDLVAGRQQQRVIFGSPVPPERWAFPERARWGAYHALQTSRGCAHACAFCSANAFADPGGRPAWRGLDAATVRAWLERARRAGASFVELVDSDFLGTNAAGLARAEALAKAGPCGPRVMAATRADTIAGNRRLIAGLREAGFVKWQVGVESGDEGTLRRFKKGFSASVSMTAVEILRDLGAETRLEFIMFEPWSTLETLKRNLDLLVSLLERGVSIRRALFNRLRVGRWAPAIFERLLTDGRLVRHVFPLYDYADYDPAAARAFRSLVRGHGRRTGVALTLASLLERVADVGAMPDEAGARAVLASLDRALARFVGRVLEEEVCGRDGGSAASDALDRDVLAWLVEVAPRSRAPALDAAFPGAGAWAASALAAAGVPAAGVPAGGAPAAGAEEGP